MNIWKCVWHKWILLFVAAAVSKTSKTPPQVWAVLHSVAHSSTYTTRTVAHNSTYTHSVIHSSTYTTDFSSKLDYQDSINWCAGTHSSSTDNTKTTPLTGVQSWHQNRCIFFLSTYMYIYIYGDLNFLLVGAGYSMYRGIRYENNITSLIIVHCSSSCFMLLFLWISQLLHSRSVHWQGDTLCIIKVFIRKPRD